MSIIVYFPESYWENEFELEGLGKIAYEAKSYRQ